MKQKQWNLPATGIYISAKDSSACLLTLDQLCALLNELCGEKFNIVLVKGGSVSPPPVVEDSHPSSASTMPASTSVPSAPSLPKELDVDEIKQMLQALADCGELTADWQLRNQSWTERAVIVAYMSGKQGERCMWSAFAQLWHCDKKVLKGAYSKHADSLAGREYFQKLENILN